MYGEDGCEGALGSTRPQATYHVMRTNRFLLTLTPLVLAAYE